jgi:hypothetical protein
MKIFFNKRFEEEVLSNEKLRITILIGMFVFAMLYLMINISIEKITATGKPEIESMLHLLVFFVLFWFSKFSHGCGSNIKLAGNNIPFMISTGTQTPSSKYVHRVLSFLSWQNSTIRL